MLTRLKISGFKNLVNVDVSFGPVTCIAGVNGVGKSNLFDAITFLSALADRPLLDAARSVRDEGGHTTDVRSLFHRIGESYDSEMSFDVEMLVPPRSVDDLGQEATASITFLRYTLKLAYRTGDGPRPFGSLEILEETLTHINKGDARSHLAFPHSRAWRESVADGKRAGGDFISTQDENGQRAIKLHQDGGSRGRPHTYLASTLPRTVLSATNAAESPTALIARNEMRSWRLLQLEPSALRTPTRFADLLQDTVQMGTDGSYLPATLYHLAHGGSQGAVNDVHAAEAEAAEVKTAQVYARVAARLAELISDVREVWVERDERLQVLTLYLKDRYHTAHPAQSLSDGTMRFLALAVLELDPDAQGVLCLEEPENGLHPARISAMIHLLRDIASDTNAPVDATNPLRQVIFNTHSPAVVTNVNDDELLIAEPIEMVEAGRQFKTITFRWLTNTWRVNVDPDPHKQASVGSLLFYLNRGELPEDGYASQHPASPQQQPDGQQPRRVAERPDVHTLWDALTTESA